MFGTTARLECRLEFHCFYTAILNDRGDTGDKNAGSFVGARAAGSVRSLPVLCPTHELNIAFNDISLRFTHPVCTSNHAERFEKTPSEMIFLRKLSMFQIRELEIRSMEVCSTPEIKFQPRLLPKCTPYFCVLGNGSA